MTFYEDEPKGCLFSVIVVLWPYAAALLAGALILVFIPVTFTMAFEIKDPDMASRVFIWLAILHFTAIVGGIRWVRSRKNLPPRLREELEESEKKLEESEKKLLICQAQLTAFIKRSQEKPEDQS